MDDKNKQTPTRSRCILLVQSTHEPSNLEASLQNAGLDIIHVGTLSEAREAMSAVAFPLVLIDALLGEDARVLIAELRRRYGRQRVHITLLVDGSDAEPPAFGADESLDKRSASLTERILATATRIELDPS